MVFGILINGMPGKAAMLTITGDAPDPTPLMKKRMALKQAKAHMLKRGEASR